MEITQEYSRAVFDDGVSCVQDPSHPCHHFIRWQQDRGYNPIQLPEPFSGGRSTLGLAFMGLNPSITHDEIIPGYGEATFAEYDRYYRTRFDANNRDYHGRLMVTKADGSTKLVRLWGNLERFGKEFLSSEFRLGTEAVLLEAIRYKSTEGWLGNPSERRRTLEHQRPFTERFIDELGLSVIVPMGNEALGQLHDILSFTVEPPRSVLDATGHTFLAKTRKRTAVTICPIKHMSYPPSGESKQKVANEIKRAIQ